MMRYATALPLVCLCAVLSAGAAFAQSRPSQQAAVGAVLSGRVMDASGRPADGAQVSAELRGGTGVVTVPADASGKFLLRGLQPGTYTVHAASHGMESSRSTLAVSQASPQDITIVLGSPGDAIDFTDKPTFAVAGVTDWTAVGGHGSDATLRTSEELNREALALRAAQSTPAHGSGAKGDDEYNLALTQYAAGDVAGARLHMERALLQRDAAEFHRLAGDIEEKLGNPLAAVQQYQRATQIDPDEANYVAWGTELLLHRAIWQAVDVFANGSRKYPASLRIKTAWGAALFAAAMYDEAAAKICEASDMDPADREPYLFAGKIALVSAATNPCVGRTLERFLHGHPQDAEANYFYAMFLLKQGAAPATDRVRQLLLRAVALDAKCSDGYLQLGILSAAQKEYRDAISYYQKALEANPQNGEAHYRLGIVYDRTGEPAKAKAEYQFHEQIDAANAALVESQRRAVKQFSFAPADPPASR